VHALEEDGGLKQGRSARNCVRILKEKKKPGNLLNREFEEIKVDEDRFYDKGKGWERYANKMRKGKNNKSFSLANEEDIREEERDS